MKNNKNNKLIKYLEKLTDEELIDEFESACEIVGGHKTLDDVWHPTNISTEKEIKEGMEERDIIRELLMKRINEYKNCKGMCGNKRKESTDIINLLLDENLKKVYIEQYGKWLYDDLIKGFMERNNINGK